MRPENEKGPRRAGVPDTAEHWSRTNHTRRRLILPDTVETLIDLWHDVADRFLAAAWWRLVDGAGLADCEGYRLSQKHFASDCQWRIARAITACWQFDVSPTIDQISELSDTISYPMPELRRLRFLESGSTGIHSYARLLVEYGRRHRAVVRLERAKLQVIDPTVPIDSVIGGLCA